MFGSVSVKLIWLQALTVAGLVASPCAADDTTAEDGGQQLPQKLGPFLVWEDDAYSTYEENEFHYSKYLVGSSALHGCCATHVHVLWERRHDEIHSVDTKYPLAVAVPNFICEPQGLIDSAVQQVRDNPESFDHIESRMKSTDKNRRGGGYPGPQITAGVNVSTQMLRCIKPVMSEYFPYIDQVRRYVLFFCGVLSDLVSSD